LLAVKPETIISSRKKQLIKKLIKRNFPTISAVISEYIQPAFALHRLPCVNLKQVCKNAVSSFERQESMIEKYAISFIAR